MVNTETGLIYPFDSKLSRPFHFIEETEVQGARIGGTMPEDIIYSFNETAEYFGTFPVYSEKQDLYFSVIINCTFAELIASLNQGLQKDNRIVVVLHKEAPRSTSIKFSSKINAHSLVISDPVSDYITNSSGISYVRERHKFGGMPFCIQEDLPDGTAAAINNGYRHILQIDFPGIADINVSGSWPFGDGIFNLFWKFPFENNGFFWCIQG